MSANQANQQISINKQLLLIEVVICINAAIVLLAFILFAAFVPMEVWQVVTLISISILQFLVTACVALKIEQVVGFYRCTKCGHSYIPSYGSTLWAFHFGRTRYLKCPKCGQKSWQKKVLTENGKAAK